jgi:hypothetical protein
VKGEGGRLMRNILWTNSNPNPETVCEACRQLIGLVFHPDSCPVCPVHPGCFCATEPTDIEVTYDGDATGFNDDSIAVWKKYAAYLLRKGYDVPTFYRDLVPDAEKYNETRQAQGVTMKLEDITPESLKKVDDQELLSLHHRLHQIWGRHFERTSDETAGSLKREDVWNWHKLVVAEMKDRGINHNVESLIDTRLGQFNPCPHLPDTIMVVPQFVSIVGSITVTGEGADVDVFLRTAPQNRMTMDMKRHCHPGFTGFESGRLHESELGRLEANGL